MRIGEQPYRVKFWNHETGKGWIDGYGTARRAKEVVAKVNELFIAQGMGMRAEYLGKMK